MSVTATLATTLRVLTQLRRDPRTIALIIGVPCLLVTLIRYVFDAQPGVRPHRRSDARPLSVHHDVHRTSITMLRERVTGTLERLMTLPLAKLDILLGYAIAFALLAVIQSTVVSLSRSDCSTSTCRDRSFW
jgi:ABC-2 type transport system permease protein